MISLILPYWDRQEAADRAFALLDRHYADLDLEVIVVDDGNRVPFRVPKTGLKVRVVRLPDKSEPKAQPTCWNAGVRAAKGDVIVLSCVEVLHVEPVLAQLEAAVREAGPMGYVLAAAWCPDTQEWHCHSTYHHPEVAEGTGSAYCAALHRSLFDLAGGFDEAYRGGAGYEDLDFINRLLRAGARFIKRDDLVVHHPKAGAQIIWAADAFERNRKLYRKRWPYPPMSAAVEIVCLKAGPMYGPEYVNILFDMVTRNLPAGYPGRFWCITDDATGLDPGIRVIDLPADLERWWGKLYMFRRGLFPDGARCAFFDLDTVVVGALSEILSYRGQFATLRDLGGGAMLGPAVILWEAGEFAASVWEEWVAQGKPRHPRGDQWWLTNLQQGRFPKMIDILQDEFPGAFRSFKFDCDPYFPAGTRVVCFHGEPRPHSCAEEWVRACWKVGGGTAAELAAQCNTGRELLAANVRSSMARGLPQLDFIREHGGHAVIVGGGPSLNETVEEVRWRKSIGQTIFALNGAGLHLRSLGIEPDHVVITDARPENAMFSTHGAHHFIASHCAPAVFDAAGSATVYHVNQSGVAEALEGEQILISTGSTVGLVTMGIAHVLGYRNFHLYGMDSSLAQSGHHAYAQPQNDGDAVIECSADGERFRCAPWMLLQAQQFQSLAVQLAEEGCVITVAGSGLLPHVAKRLGELMEA